MKKVMVRRLLTVFAAAALFFIFAVPAFAKESKLAKQNKEILASGSVSNMAALEDVKEIALDHAGVENGTAEFTKAKLDKGVYELKFRDETNEYEYKISAFGASILEYRRNDLTYAVPENRLAWEGAVSCEEACQAALNDAGVDESDLKYLVCYVSWIDHVPAAYEVKFAVRQSACRYTIDLSTGSVLERVCQPYYG